MSFSGEIHPAAELFPLMGDDDIAALAADIKANGLRQPIVLDGDGKLVDGRKRGTEIGVHNVVGGLRGYAQRFGVNRPRTLDALPYLFESAKEDAA